MPRERPDVKHFIAGCLMHYHGKHQCLHYAGAALALLLSGGTRVGLPHWQSTQRLCSDTSDSIISHP